jgi:hypothetical protein
VFFEYYNEENNLADLIPGTGAVFVRLQKRTQALYYLALGQSADKAVDKLAVLEHKHCGHTHYLVLGSEAGTLIHVDLCEFYKP